MGEPEEAAAIATPPVRFERRTATQGFLLERIEKATERINAISEKLAGPRLRAKIADEQKRGAGRLLDALERELTALEECL